MTTTSRLLAVLLGVQLVVAGGLLYANHSKRAVRPQGLLLEYDVATIDKLEIHDEEDNHVVLTKVADEWRFAEHEQLPLVSEQIDSAVSSMSTLQTGWPVATKASSHSQLEVSDSDFQRQVKLYSAGKLAHELYLGTAPGMRRVHARRNDSDDVFSVELNTYDLPATRANWLKKDLLAVEAITSVVGGGLTLEKAEGNWQLSDGEVEAHKLDAELAKGFVSALQTLTVEDLADDVPGGAEAISLQVKSADEEYEYQLMSVNEDYFISRNDIDAVFTFGQASYETLAAQGLAGLIFKPVETETANPESAIPGPVTE